MEKFIFLDNFIVYKGDQSVPINDSFVHTYRSELASAQVNGETYGYDYDNIGNRRMAMEASDYAFYEANNLNQYSSIQRNEEEVFVPSFDADGPSHRKFCIFQMLIFSNKTPPDNKPRRGLNPNSHKIIKVELLTATLL